MRPRVSARISQTCKLCVQGDHGGGRVAQRCYGTVRKTELSTTSRAGNGTSPFDVAAATRMSANASISDVQKSNELLRTKPTNTTTVSSTAATAPAPSQPPSRIGKSPYHIPEVLISAEDARSTKGPKIHILGQDERSTFIAHALSGVYDSVSLLSWRPNPGARYQSVQPSRNDGQRGFLAPVRRELKQEAIGENDEPIENLVVAQKGYSAMQSLKSVSNQITKDTNVCVVHEGLGVLEDVRQQFLNDGVDGLPRLYGGYMSHKLVRNRKLNGVRQLKHGSLSLYESRTPEIVKQPELKVETTGLYGVLNVVPELHAEMMGFSTWLERKLPSVVFDTVVEPVCAFFDLSYGEMQYNKPALTLMNQLLHELKSYTRVAPEMQVAGIQMFMGDNFLAAKKMLTEIGARRSAPSDLNQRLKTGLPTGVEHTVQYFMRKGKKLGVDMPRLEMMVHAIHAKSVIAQRQYEAYIPMEETSLPSDVSLRHGLYENTAKNLQELEKGRRTHRLRRSE